MLHDIPIFVKLQQTVESSLEEEIRICFHKQNIKGKKLRKLVCPHIYRLFSCHFRTKNIHDIYAFVTYNNTG